MLINLFNSECLHEIADLSFSYAISPSYEKVFQEKLEKNLSIYPLRWPNLHEIRFFKKVLPRKLYSLTIQFARAVLYGPLFLFQTVLLFCIFRKTKPDILHVNNGGYPGARSALAATVAAKFARVPTVLMVVNNMAIGRWHYSRLCDFPIDWVVARCTNVFITGSRTAKDRLKNVLNLPEEKVLAIHNGIKPRPESSTTEATRQRLGLDQYHGVVFGVVALMIKRKGHIYLLEAIRNIIYNNNLTSGELKVIIEGDGELRVELEEFVRIHKINGCISFIGVEDNIFDFMRAIDVLVFPSVENEDFPNVIIEAMSLGKPVISSIIAGTVEQIENQVTGILVKPRNISDLMDAIVQLATEPIKRKFMGSAACDRYNKHFSSVRAVENYIRLYKHLSNK